MGTGGAASQRAQNARRQERLLREQWQAARRQALRWDAVGAGEQRVLAQLLVLTARGWRLLVDRRWSGTSTADADMLLVGPGGVFVVDVTDGAEPRDGHEARLLAATKAAESAVASLGMSPVAVQPLMVFPGRSSDASLGRIRLLGEQEIGPVLLSQPHRLRGESVRAIADHLERVFPDYAGSAVDQQVPSAPEHHRQSLSDGLFDLEGLRDAAVKGAMRAPIEQWMTFLHPDQVALVRRNWSGPARISGPAGTGKTVVALHRAAHLARRTTGRILYVTFANNLPRVQSTFLRTMAPGRRRPSGLPQPPLLGTGIPSGAGSTGTAAR
ncbi:NERD domain-containing protein [Streptomyces sp. NPDC048257]|uniref:nuclease-related domain-containing protein n=1 Tax=Streptomyces sp. NPDC048257 TaxID=3365526 RepID=UPI00371C270C